MFSHPLDEGLAVIVIKLAWASGTPTMLLVRMLAALIQREMVPRFTTSLDCVTIELIHSDYSFVCDVSQNHFNTGSHYGFLFFD